jgi:hypothetical protein
MPNLGREALNKDTFKRMVVEVPEWGGTALIRELSAAEVARVQQIANDAVDVATRTVKDASALARFQAEVVVAGWIDDSGNNVLTLADVDNVLAQPSKIVILLSREISKLSGMEATSSIEEAPVAEAKNG